MCAVGVVCTCVHTSTFCRLLLMGAQRQTVRPKVLILCTVRVYCFLTCVRYCIREGGCGFSRCTQVCGGCVSSGGT